MDVTRRSVLGGGAAMALLTACGPGGSDRTPAADGSLVALDDLDVGESARIAVGETTVIVTRTGDDTAVAFDATCTHRSCTVKRNGDALACPCHGSAFDPRTGAVTHGPASAPLAPVAVRVEGGRVLKA